MSAARRTRVLLLGAGGHASVVADSVLRAAEAGAPLELVGFLDDSSDLHGTEVLGRPVLGPIDLVGRVEHDALVAAIGDNRARAELVARLGALGAAPLLTVIHPTAVIAPDARIGAGSMISAAVVITTGTVIGENVIANTGCTVDHHCRIGDFAHIGPGAHLGGNVIVGEGALVGIGSSVAPGRSIGDWSIIGAGAAVVDSVADNITAVGVPARSRPGVRGG